MKPFFHLTATHGRTQEGSDSGQQHMGVLRRDQIVVSNTGAYSGGYRQWSVIQGRTQEGSDSGQ